MEKTNQNFKKHKNQNNKNKQTQNILKDQTYSNNMSSNHKIEDSSNEQNDFVYVPKHINNQQQQNIFSRQFSQEEQKQQQQNQSNNSQKHNIQKVEKNNFQQDNQQHKNQRKDQSQKYQQFNNEHQNMKPQHSKKERDIQQKQNYKQDKIKDKNFKEINNNENKSDDNKDDRYKLPKELQNIYLKEHDKYLQKLQYQNNEELFWLCKTCLFKNDWRSEQKCSLCKDTKFRAYERMRTDEGQDDYDYLFFIDYECNNTPKDGFEIIELPIQVVDVQQKKIVKSFSSYVRPTSPVTEFIQQLTKISNTQVQKAPILSIVLEQANKFLQPYLQNGLDRCCIVYDCDSDANFLNNETRKKNINIPPIFQKYITLKSIFPAHITNPPYLPTSINKMLITFQMQFEGQKHCGFDDCYNQARVGIRLLEEGYYYSNKQENKLGEVTNQNQHTVAPIEYLIHIEFDLVRDGGDSISEILNDLSQEMCQQPSSNSQDYHGSNSLQQNQNKSKNNKYFTLKAGSMKMVKMICSVSQIQNQQIQVMDNEQNIWEFEIPEIENSDAINYMKLLFTSLFVKLDGLDLNDSRFTVVTSQPMYKQLMNQALLTLSKSYEKDYQVTLIFENVKKYLSHYITISQYTQEIIKTCPNKIMHKSLESEAEDNLINIFKNRCSKTNINNTISLLGNLLKVCTNYINMGSLINL